MRRDILLFTKCCEICNSCIKMSHKYFYCTFRDHSNDVLLKKYNFHFSDVYTEIYFLSIFVYFWLHNCVDVHIRHLFEKFHQNQWKNCGIINLLHTDGRMDTTIYYKDSVFAILATEPWKYAEKSMFLF